MVITKKNPFSFVKMRMLYVCWDMKDVAYYKVLNCNEIIIFREILLPTESKSPVFIEKPSVTNQLQRCITLALE